MVNSSPQRPLDLVFAPLARAMARTGLSPSILSGLGFVAALAGAAGLIVHAPVPAACLFVAGRLALQLTHAAAVASGRSWGTAHRLDVFDQVTLAAMAFAFGLADPAGAPAALFLLFALIAAFSAWPRDERGAARDIFTLAVSLGFVVACIVPGWFGLIAYAGGIVAFLLCGVAFASSVLDLEP
jgi:hypothetical protein